MEETKSQGSPHILKSFPKEKFADKKNLKIIFLSVAVVMAGVVSGWFLSGEGAASVGKRTSENGIGEIERTETEAGLEDESLFPDNTQGILREGGIEGEGTHHLERPGGASQSVYLTSTVIDLQTFVGKEVMVWGETLSAVHAPWLMDVGKIKVVQ